MKSKLITLLCINLIAVMQTTYTKTIALNDLKQILKQSAYSQKSSLIVPEQIKETSSLSFLHNQWKTLIKDQTSLLRDNQALKKFQERIITIFDNPTMKLGTTIDRYIQQAAKSKRKTITIVGTSNNQTLKSLTIKPTKQALHQALGSIVSAYFDVNHVNRRLKEGKRELFPDSISIQLK